MKANIKYLIAIAVLSFTGLRAQVLTGGIEGEVTTSSVKISGIPNATVNVINGKNITGYEAGFFLKLGVAPLYLKPKFLISYQSGTMQSIYPDGEQTDVTFNVTKLDIPVLIGLKILGPLSIEAGPVYNRIISATKDFNGNTIELRPGGLGYRVGANAQFGVLGLNVSYQGVKTNSSGSLSSFETPDQLILGVSLGF